MSEDKAPEAPPAYLTAEQVAERVQVFPPTIYRWALDDSSMPVLRVGRTVRFPRERLERWLRGREQGHGRARAEAAGRDLADARVERRKSS
jgi:excisionase family DNA binding protein